MDLMLNNTAYNNSLYSNEITTYGMTGTGIRLTETVNSNNIYSNNITTNGSASIGILLSATAFSNSVYSNIVVTYNESSSGIGLASTVYNNTIYNNNITALNATKSGGIVLINHINNNTFHKNMIFSLSGGIVVNGTTDIVAEETRFNTFTNDTIIPCSLGCAGNYQDIVLTANATDITFTNVSFNKSRVAFVPRDLGVPVEKNNLTIRWFLDVRVARNTDNTALQGAEVVVNNSFGANVFTDNTDANGRIATVTVTEFTMNGSVPFNAATDTCVGINNVNITCFTPMNISVNLSGYNSNFTSVDVNRSKLVNVSLSLAVDVTAPAIVTGFNASSPLVNDVINFTGNITDTGLTGLIM